MIFKVRLSNIWNSSVCKRPVKPRHQAWGGGRLDNKTYSTVGHGTGHKQRRHAGRVGSTTRGAENPPAVRSGWQLVAARKARKAQPSTLTRYSVVAATPAQYGSLPCIYSWFGAGDPSTTVGGYVAPGCGVSGPRMLVVLGQERPFCQQ